MSRSSEVYGIGVAWLGWGLQHAYTMDDIWAFLLCCYLFCFYFVPILKFLFSVSRFPNYFVGLSVSDCDGDGIYTGFLWVLQVKSWSCC